MLFLAIREKFGQGRENVKAFLAANLPVAEEIEAKIREKAFGLQEVKESKSETPNGKEKISKNSKKENK